MRPRIDPNNLAGAVAYLQRCDPAMKANPSMSCKALLAAASLLIGVSDSAGEPLSDLTIEVTGDLLNYGGVVVVYTIPIPADAWTKTVGDSPATNIRLDGRYAEVQLRYPKGGRFAYRFRPVEGTPDANKHATQVLSVIGTDMEDRGPQMTAGFENAYSDGGQIIRVPPLAELTGQDEATRTMARWGETERNDAPPLADPAAREHWSGSLNMGRNQFLFAAMVTSWRRSARSPTTDGQSLKHVGGVP